MMKWEIELCEFYVSYQSRTAIKGQVLVDFLIELTPIKANEMNSLELE